MQGKFYSMKVVAKSGAMWSKIGGSRQAHHEKVAQGRRNEALLANRAEVEDIAHQIARIASGWPRRLPTMLCL